MTTPAPSVPADPRRILIVDIDEQVTSFLTFKLRRQHYEVLTLTSTVNALAAIRDFKPHLIISEMVLPELSGVDFLKRIRMNPETAHIPFIFLSSSRNVEDKILAHEMGAEAFFPKPIFIKVLVNRINDLFQEIEFKKMLSPSSEERFDGLLQNISVMDLLNIVHENRRNGIIELASTGKETGRIFFSEGAILRVEKEDADNRQGEEILYALLPWDEGSFHITYLPERPVVESNVFESFDYLIVHATRWLSDYQNGINGIPSPDTRLYLQFSSFIEHLAKLPDSMGAILRMVSKDGVFVGELLEKGGADRRQTIEQIKKLLSFSILTDAPRPDEVTLPPVPAWARTGTHEETPTPPEENRRWAPSPELPGSGLRNRATTPREPVPSPVAVPAPETPVPAPDTPSKTEQTAAPLTSETKPASHAPESTLLQELYQEHAEVKSPSRRLSLVSFAVVIALVAAGVALWYTLSERGEEKRGLSPAPVTATVTNTPDTVVIPPAAERPADAAKKQDPFADKKPEELVVLGTAAHTAERYDEAVSLYQAALTRLPKEDPSTAPLRAKALKNLAIVLYDTDRYEGALEAALASRAITDDEPEKIDLTAAILEQMGDFDGAIETYRTALKNRAFKANATGWKKEIARLKKEKKKKKRE